METNQLIRVFTSVENNPIILTNIMTQVYFQDYFEKQDLEYSAIQLIEEFYCLHYSGKRIGNDKITKIVNQYFDNIPMLILCVYLLDIDDDHNLIKLAIPNLHIVFSLIQNAYNNVTPNGEWNDYTFTPMSVMEVMTVINEK